MDGYREKLLGLDRERLVDALVKIAARPETAGDVIERLLNTPDENRHRARRADQLIRAGHHDLAPMAEALEDGGHPLAATLCYRALTDAVLARGASNDYHHGVRYLKRLDALAPAITGWGEFPGHREYVQRIVENHKRKRSFWGQYGGIPGV